MSREEIEEFRRHREWWKRPDPYDPRNALDEEEAEDQSACAASDAAQVERAGSRDDHETADPTDSNGGER